MLSLARRLKTSISYSIALAQFVNSARTKLVRNGRHRFAVGLRRLFEAEGDLFFKFAGEVDVGASVAGSALDENSADFGTDGFDLDVDGGVVDFGHKSFVDTVFVDDGAVEAEHFKGGEVEVFDGSLIAAFNGVLHPRQTGFSPAVHGGVATGRKAGGGQTKQY